jgi:hypothetical protein
MPERVRHDGGGVVALAGGGEHAENQQRDHHFDQGETIFARFVTPDLFQGPRFRAPGRRRSCGTVDAGTSPA